MCKLGNTLGYLLINFATPAAFFVTFRFYGPKPAIALAILVTVVQLFAHWLHDIRPSPFFIVASGFTVLFGGIDLFLAHPRYYRLEPFAQNMVMGIVFLTTAALDRPIAGWFAAALPARFRPKASRDMHDYLRKVTVVWGVYFVLKATLFLWLAFHVDLGELILLRTLIGGVTLAMLIGGEILYRRYWRETV